MNQLENGMSEYKDRLRAISNQDQELAEIVATWNSTDTDMKAEFLGWLDSNDMAEVRVFLDECPDQWLWFIQKCCLAGIRQAVLIEPSAEW